VSLTRACRLIGYNRSNVYYRRKSKDDAALKGRMHELAQERPRWGWRRLFIVLRRRPHRALAFVCAGDNSCCCIRCLARARVILIPVA
jgi:hypothetical protein